MHLARNLVIAILLGALATPAWSADVLLNEYNAVGGLDFLGGGDASADASGGRAGDSYFGRVQGNGGDWFELVVVTDHLDMRGWQLDIFDGGILDETLGLTDHLLWSDLRSGTIITVAEDVATDVSYNPGGGDWWINVQVNNDADGVYIEASSFPVGSNNWQLRIRDAAGAVVFGPAGEGISPVSGVSGTEVFRLEETPSDAVTADSKDYDDGADFSTFGAPNRWGTQDLATLRTALPEVSTITLLSPNEADLFTAGTPVTVSWASQGTIGTVLVEFSLDNGGTWSPVYPPNAGNSGQYTWVIPPVSGVACLMRVSSAARPSVYDVSDVAFEVFPCAIEADLTGDCIVDFFDFALLASAWLESQTP